LLARDVQVAVEALPATVPVATGTTVPAMPGR
jgi:hypothetical protein